MTSSGLDLTQYDPNTRIQDDLYLHANGKWMETHEIPADRSIDGAFRGLVDLAEERVRDIIEDAAASETAVPGSVEAKIGDLFASFMDEKHIDDLGVAPIAGELAAISGCETKAQLAQAFGTLARTHGASPFGVFVNNDAKDPDINRLYFYQGGLGLPDEAYYREEQHAETREKYVEHIAKMLKMAGVASDFGVGTAETVKDGDFDNAAQQVMDLETKLATHHWDLVKDREETLVYNPMSFEQLAKSAPEYNWDGWAAALGLNPKELVTVIVREPSFFEGFGKIWAETPLSVWKLWAAYHLITSRSAYLANKVVEANFDFYGRTLSGTPEVRERWKRGVSAVEGALGEAVGEVYVSKYFPPSHKAAMDQLVA
ncbi:MAG: peptidase M13, partial [Cellulomonadaceae bacterium]|nr:peptidase M13 [Cellulomonadaceae bacterium]